MFQQPGYDPMAAAEGRVVLEDHLSHLSDTLRKDLVSARKAVSTLLVGKVKFTPVELGGGKRTYELEAELTLGKVLSAVAQTLSVPDSTRCEISAARAATN
jgi:hypothetical protein